ncbi:MAG: tail fiber domain-containing protein [Candidatus Saccharibacteria bacterium]
MKKIQLFFITCLVALSFGAMAQIQVNSSGYVGIGTTPSSSYRLKVGGSSYFSGSSTFNGNSTFNYPVVISGPPATSPFLVVSGSTGSAPTVLITGTTTGYILSINGNALATGGTWQGSDSKLKKNITPLDGKSMLLKIMNVDGKKYEFKNKEELKEVYSKLSDDTLVSKMIPQLSEGEQYGFIAQEIEKDFPELVKTDSITKLKAVNYDGMIPVLLQAIKEQQVQLAQLQQQMDQVASAGLKSAAITSGANALTITQARLDQNIPNPFNRETKIGCSIPESSISAVLYIYNMNGAQLQQYPINGKGKQTVTISGNTLEPGMYLYALVVDGREADTKRMILTK